MGEIIPRTCYCVAVFLRAAFRSRELPRVYECVGCQRSVSRTAAVKPRASILARSSGYPAVCTPSPHTVSAPRVRSIKCEWTVLKSEELDFTKSIPELADAAPDTSVYQIQNNHNKELAKSK
ncbi:hypothetical protein EVAR_87152_1 [Eumeta japonica]|uniref:Uncharacterized protein n=1 Tax=Eumeta variegata TaxID=151549 RepID=A0A4C1VV12_EUMVA|nr:hypothetical protein EVAR_87152_1 [Eumeta japonica]